MKKTIALLIAAVCLISLWGCGGEPEDEAPPVKYSGEYFGPVKVGEGADDVYVGLDTAFIYIFTGENKEEPSQMFTVSGFDDVGSCLKGIKADDASADGYTDLMIPFRRVDDLQYYYVYVWDNDTSSYVLIPSMSSVGNLEVTDGCLKGIASEHGAFHEVEYIWENGRFVEDEGDEYLQVARELAAGMLGGADVTLTFGRDELIDMTISRLYFVSEGADVTSYIAVSYDKTRGFFSPASSVYFDIVRDGDKYKKGDSHKKMEYEGIPYGYGEAEYDKLDGNQKEYYGMIGSKLHAYDKIDFESSDAAAAMNAYMKDHPVWSQCFVPQIMGYSVGGYYCYTWDNFNTETSKETLSEKMDEYSKKVSDVVSQMPTGLEPIEKYVYLAQKLSVISEEEHHHGKD